MSIPNNSCVGILGANGCGKSTFLSILAGVRHADSGQFLVEGVDLLSDKKMHQQLVGYVPQGSPFFENLTAYDNLRLFCDNKIIEKETSDGCIKLLGVDRFLNKKVRELSGGMQKRLLICCAVANRPRILLLDEPSAALDLECKEIIAGYLSEYRNAGGTILLITHDEREISLCDKCYIIKNGVAVNYNYDGDVKKLIGSFYD